MRRILLFAAIVRVAFAGAPMITELIPRGAEIGRPFTLTVMGRYLGEGARVTSTMPASFTPVNGMRGATFLVEPKPDVAPGVYPIRIETPGGISNILLFTLGTFPEINEEETKPNSNDTIETAEPVPNGPIVVNGRLRGPERDMFRVTGKTGERRVFEVEARRCGSAIDPVLRIFDGSGKQLAKSDDTPGAGLDARIDLTFPADGNYYVEVTDARFSKQAQDFYRLKMGTYTYADWMYPLGGPRGKATQVTFSNGAKTTISAPSTGAFTTAGLPGSPALPFLFAVSDLPEVMEPVDPAPVPGVINGRLDKPGEIDRYRLKANPGDHLLLELQARELGTSHLEGIITAYDTSGKKIDSAGDKPLPEDVFAVQQSSRTSSDPFLNLTVPANTNEIVVTIEDLALRGGPLYGYRLIARKQAQDFRLSIATPYVNIPAGGTAAINVSADRRGYDGPIQLTIPKLPQGIHVEGGTIPRESVDANNARTVNRRGVLLLTAEPGVSFDGDLEVWGEGGDLRRRARGVGIMTDVAGATAQGVVDRQRPLTAPWLGLELPAAVGEAPAGTVEVRETSVKQMAEGARYEFEYHWKLRGRAMPPKAVSVDINGARDIRVIDMQRDSFAVTTTKATEPARYDLYITGRVKTEEGEEVIVSRPIVFEVTGVANVASN